MSVLPNSLCQSCRNIVACGKPCHQSRGQHTPHALRKHVAPCGCRCTATGSCSEVAQAHGIPFWACWWLPHNRAVRTCASASPVTCVSCAGRGRSVAEYPVPVPVERHRGEPGHTKSQPRTGQTREPDRSGPARDRHRDIPVKYCIPRALCAYTCIVLHFSFVGSGSRVCTVRG